MEEKRFTFVKRYLQVKTKANCEIWCKEGRSKTITITDTEDGDFYIFMRKDFLYSHSDTTITMCHLLFRGENLDSLEIEESDFLPNFTTKEEFIEYKEKHKEEFEEHKEENKAYEEQNEKDKEEMNNAFEEHKEENAKQHEELKKSMESCIEIKREELLELRNNSQLVKGKWYLIKDYFCVVNSNITTIKSVHHNFSILVFAVSENTLSETAFAEKPPKEFGYLLVNGKPIPRPNSDCTYFKYCNFNAWEIKYCIDNDQDRFPWCGSDADGGRGVIWYMKDEYGNEAYYDFKNIMEVRYEVTEATKEAGGSPTMRFFTSEKTRTNWTINTENPFYFFTFSYCSEAALTQTQSSILDLSVQNIKEITATISDSTYKNFSSNRLLDRHFINGTIEDFHINCFLVINGKAEVDDVNFSKFVLEGNELGNFSYGNTFNCIYKDEENEKNFKVYTKDNILKQNNYNNTFGANCYDNGFGSNCYSNSFWYQCYNNSFGNGCYSNSLTSTCFNNSFANGCYSNSLGERNEKLNLFVGCSSISLGNNCFLNLIQDSCDGISLGNNCCSNSFFMNSSFSGCSSIFLGNDCSDNSFTGYCYSISFATWCRYNTLSETYFSSLGNGCLYWTITDSKGCFIGNNISGTESTPRTISSKTNVQYWS